MIIITIVVIVVVAVAVMIVWLPTKNRPDHHAERRDDRHPSASFGAPCSFTSGAMSGLYGLFFKGPVGFMLGVLRGAHVSYSHCHGWYMAISRTH